MNTEPNLPEAYRSTEALEQALGSPLDPGNAFAFSRSVALDEAAAYPEEACRALESWGLHSYYLPPDCGGRGARFDEVMSLVRAVARRDLTAAVAHTKTALASVPVWLAGDEAQRQRLARRVLGGEQVALGLTERAHGADILASEVHARRTGGRYDLRGEKWLINNATRGSALVLFARTDERAGVRGCSLFFLEKEALPQGSYRCLPRVKTHGIRGADISGIELLGAEVGTETLLGKEGDGLDWMLKSLQITRAACAALSLGAGDTALRVALDFAASRRLYGQRVLDLPPARSQLVGAFVDLLMADCVALCLSRTLHTAPGHLALRAAVCKYFVPTRVEQSIRQAATVLGARHFLREDYASGVFQKIMRDAAVVPLFDGSTEVNLASISQQLKVLYRPSAAQVTPGALEDAFGLFRPLPPLNRSGLRLLGPTREEVVQGFTEASGALNQETLKLVRRYVPSAGPLLERLFIAAHTLEAVLKEERRKPVMGTRGFEAARHYARLFAACCCVHTWTANREWLETKGPGTAWLPLALGRLLDGALGGVPAQEALEVEVSARMLTLHEQGRAFALVPLRLSH